jgi:hypothetical protein
VPTLVRQGAWRSEARPAVGGASGKGGGSVIGSRGEKEIDVEAHDGDFRDGGFHERGITRNRTVNFGRRGLNGLDDFNDDHQTR